MINILIPIAPVTKKNHGTIKVRSGKPLMLPSKQYRQYESDAGWFLKDYAGMNITKPVNIKCLFYMPTKRVVDLPNLLNAIDDVLVHYNVIEDDNRDIVATHDGSKVLYDKENSRTEIEITFLEGYEQWKKRTWRKGY